MNVAFETILPMFGLVLCGYIVGNTRLISEEGITGIVNFVFYIVIPALLFRAIGSAQLTDPELIFTVLAYHGAALTMFIIANGVGKFAFSLPLEERAILGMGTMYGNTTLLGIPIIFTVFGEPGLVPLLLVISFHGIVLLPVTILTIEIGKGRHSENTGNIGQVILSALIRNPIVVALIATIAWMATGITTPTPIDRFTELLSDAAAPTALFALGASLARERITGSIPESIAMTAMKLFLLPTLVWISATHVFGLRPEWAMILTITAAMPTGANVFMTARHYKVYVARATSGTIISTALSVVTLTVLLSYFTAKL